ncbi:amidohydrolase [Flavobacterium succinicans]|uniref:Imidazolonepropionase n=1 Tax=Flavobacterium succinicans TaxID=29536 RepID=A0A199XPN4_9FLAO|nr:amidohydrolase family protein [Flavobacterium succinicans]OAZ03211.1 imidazolonepropionase [Flavobacterium succinicans]
MSDTHNHNHEDCIGCGCYNPAFDLLLNTTNSNETKDARAESVQENEVPKSMIFYNGIIYPVQRKDENEKIVDVTDPDFYYEAMRIDNGMITWLGTSEKAKKEADDEKIDLQDLNGKTILPGLIEPHCHIVPSAAGDFGKYPVPLSKEWGDKIWKNYSPFDNQSDPLDPDPHYPQCLKPDYTRENLLKDVIGDAKKIAEKNNKLSYLEKKNGPYWLLGLGVDPSLMYEVYPEKHWTIDNCVDSSFFREVDLDFERSTPSLAVPPILLMSASGHTAYVNKIALSLAYSLEKEKPTPGFLEKYPTEEKYVINENCVLQEMAQMTPVMRAICKTQLKDLKDGIEGSINDYIKSARKLGVTMVYDAGMQQDWANAYFFKDGTPINHGIRIGMSLPYGIENKFEKANEDLKKQFEDFDSFQPPTEKTINGYWGSIKITSDGSNQGLTGYQSLNYVCPSLPDPNEKGIYNFQTQAKLDPLSVDTLNDGINHNNSLVKAIVKEGWPILIHANGNQAIDYTINAYKESLGTPPTKEEMEEFQNKRNRIEHCSLLNEQNLKDMKEYGIQPSFLIGHVGYWGYVFDKYIFPKSQTVNSAAEHLDLCKSALDHSLRITLHSDNAVTPLGPLRYMEQAITRIMEGSEQAKDYYTNLKKKSGDKPTNTVFKDLPVLNESERITVMQALKAVTLDAAWQCQADHLVGSLLPGKLADFIILEKNPMLMDTPEKAYLNMRNIKVLETWVGGVQYKNG